MDINLEKGTVTIFGKTGKLDTLIRKFAMLSGEQVYHFLVNRGIQLPRKMNCLALMSVLNRRIKFLNSKSLSKDYFTRLKYYNSFTEQQLFNLFVKICNDPDSFYAYRYNLFKIMFVNFVAMDFTDGELNYGKTLKKANVESFEQYFNYISGAALEQEDTFDGQNRDVVFENLEFSASSQEIYDIAGKYGIELPQTLNKENYYNYIVWYMTQNGSYNDEIAEGLQEMSVSQLQTFSERMNVPMSPKLSKKELVNYLIFMLDNGTLETTSIKRIDTTDEFKPFIFTVDLKAVSTFGNAEAKKVIHYEGEDEDTEEFNQVLIKEEEIPEEEETEEAPIPTVIPVAEEVPVEVNEAKPETADDVLDSVLDDVVATEFVEAVYETGDNKKPEEQTEEPTAKEAPVEEAPTPEEVSEEATFENTEADVVEEAPADNQENVDELLGEFVGEGENDSSPLLDEDLSDIEAASDEEIAELLEENKEEEPAPEEIKKDETFNTSVVKNEQYGSEKIVRLGNKSTGKTVFLGIVLGVLVALLIFVLVALLR